MKTLFAGLLLTATLSSSVAPVGVQAHSTGILATVSQEELEKANADSAQNEKTRSLLAEYGLNMDGMTSAQAAYDSKSQEYQEAEARAERARHEAQRVRERLSNAQSEQARAKEEAAQAEAQVQKSTEDVGLTAATAYKQGGVSVSPAVAALLSDPSEVQDSLNANVMMDRIMSQQAGTLQSARQAEAVQGAALNRATATTEAVAKLESEVRAAEEKAEGELARAQSLKADAERLLADSQAQLKKTRDQYERAVAEADREAEAFRKRQADLLAAQKIEKRSVADEAKVVRELKSGSSSVLPLPLPSLVNRVTSGYGWRPTPTGTVDYGGKGGYVHKGIDYGLACGSPLFAVADGTVWLAGPAGTAGNAIGVSHGIVNEYAFATRYHHLAAVMVSPGDKVKRGQMIGYSGTTGNSNGCHLHFETIVNGEAVDPVLFLGTETFG